MKKFIVGLFSVALLLFAGALNVSFASSDVDQNDKIEVVSFSVDNINHIYSPATLTGLGSGSGGYPVYLFEFDEFEKPLELALDNVNKYYLREDNHMLNKTILHSKWLCNSNRTEFSKDRGYSLPLLC